MHRISPVKQTLKVNTAPKKRRMSEMPSKREDLIIFLQARNKLLTTFNLPQLAAKCRSVLQNQ